MASTSSKSSAKSSTSNTPLSNIVLSASDMENPEQFVGLLNQSLTNMYQSLIQLQGTTGPVTMQSGLDMNGTTITNVATPKSPSSGDVVTHGFAEQTYSPTAMSKALEAGGSNPLQSYRRMNDNNQREQSSSFLNDITNTAPTANNSTILAGSASGGFIPVTVTAGTFSRVDGSQVSYPALSVSLPLPTSGESVYYVYIQRRASVLFVNLTAYTSDTWQNRLASSGDGNTLVAVITLTTSGLDTVNSAGGGTSPVSGAKVRQFARL